MLRRNFFLQSQSQRPSYNTVGAGIKRDSSESGLSSSSGGSSEDIAAAAAINNNNDEDLSSPRPPPLAEARAITFLGALKIPVSLQQRIFYILNLPCLKASFYAGRGGVFLLPLLLQTCQLHLPVLAALLHQGDR